MTNTTCNYPNVSIDNRSTNENILKVPFSTTLDRQLTPTEAKSERSKNAANALYTRGLMNDVPMFDLADYIRKLRKDLDLTQEELAAKAEIGVTTLRQVETRIVTIPEMPTLAKLAAALGRDVNEFVSMLPGMNEPLPPIPHPEDRPATIPARRQSDKLSARARELAEWYEQLPTISQLAIEAVMRALRERSGL